MAYVELLLHETEEHMLIEKGYRRNKNGEIVKRETVEIKCDKCGREWKSLYGYRKRKLLDIDLCVYCRNKLAWSKTENTKENHLKVTLTCDNCKKEYEKIPSRLCKNINNFCSQKCRFDFDIKERYGHLEKSFDENSNEVAYLIGLIMGDGNINKRQKRTSTISIVFDFAERWNEMVVLSKSLLDKLQIKWWEAERPVMNCSCISFVLPDFILKKYGIFYSGNKFYAQPYPIISIIHNINYAAGLINSDGDFRVSKNSFSYGFTNTVKSITSSLSECLSFHNIKHSNYERDGKIDKRTKNRNKNQFNIYIGGKENFRILHALCRFPLKGEIIRKQDLGL